VNKEKTFNGYSREQMAKLADTSQHKRELQSQPRVVSDEDPNVKESPGENKEEKKRKKKSHRPRIKTKSDALLGLVANVNGAMSALEEESQSEWGEGKEADMDSTPRRLLHGFEALVGILLQLSDELELLSTFARRKCLCN
jgi:hypothetical protein